MIPSARSGSLPPVLSNSTTALVRPRVRATLVSPPGFISHRQAALLAAGLLALGALPSTSDAQAADSPALPRPTRAQAEWHDYEVGMFVHFAPNTWFDQEYDDLSKPPAQINPPKLDAEQWVRVADSMGAKYLVFVAKHVGGFCWWQTETSDYGVRQTPWREGKGDLMADLAAACRKHRIHLGVYLSPADRHFGVGVGGKADNPANQARYEQIFRAQLTELLSRYGTIKEVWFDGSLGFDVADILRQHAADAVVFQGPQASIRWVGNEDGHAPYPAWNAVKYGQKPWGSYTADDGDPEGDRWLPNECDARIRNTWFWRTDNLGTLKTVDQLMDMYEKSVGRGAVLLLNNTPDPTGLIPEPDAQRSAEFGAEIRRRYGTPIIDTAGKGEKLEMMLSAPRTLDAVITMEDITQGERVREYVIEGRTGEGWKTLATGTAIGHKRIDKFPPVELTELRLRILRAAAPPILRKFAAYAPRPAPLSAIRGEPPTATP